MKGVCSGKAESAEKKQADNRKRVYAADAALSSFLSAGLFWLYRFIQPGLNGSENFQKPGIVFGHHNAEPDEFAIQTLEGTAVPDHKIVFYT